MDTLQIVLLSICSVLALLFTFVRAKWGGHIALLFKTLASFGFVASAFIGIATINRNHSITSTIFGPALLDFGIVGMIIQMIFLGFILKTLHSIQGNEKSIFTAFYGILLAQTIIWIETGPTDMVVWLFYFVGIILIINTLRRGNHGI